MLTTSGVTRDGAGSMSTGEETHHRNALGSSVLDAVGSTLLVELSRITRDLDGRILAKLEYLNPGGSKKDRIASGMIRDAETSGGHPGGPAGGC
jgi:hypothetical protein